MFGLFRSHKRDAAREAHFPEAWREIIAKNVPYAAFLDDAERKELEDSIKVFLSEKTFEGCGGLELTDEIRVTIAAQACLLLLHRETDFYPGLYTVLVYPSTYMAAVKERNEIGLVTEGEEARLGEAWQQGVVVLSWDDVKAGATDVHDGHNVVFHEFAHQLDHEDGSGDGAPILDRKSRYMSWARVLGEEFKTLQEARDKHRKSVLDTYGATNPAEFFAVATECFFEKPAQMVKKHPELYQELALFYRQDPVSWGRATDDPKKVESPS